MILQYKETVIVTEVANFSVKGGKSAFVSLFVWNKQRNFILKSAV